MASEYVPIIAMITALIGLWFPIRLKYIEPKYEKILKVLESLKNNADADLINEMRKPPKQQKKDDVLSHALRFSSLKQAENDVKEWSVLDSRYSFLDGGAIGILIALGVSVLENSPIANLAEILTLVSIFVVFFSIYTFFDHLNRVITLNKKYVYNAGS